MSEPNACTCTIGVRCPKAERLNAERARLREQYVRQGKAIYLVAWQQAEMEYKQHQAQNNLNQTQGEHRE